MTPTIPTITGKATYIYIQNFLTMSLKSFQISLKFLEFRDRRAVT